MGIRSYFKGGRLARMSNGTYCIIRDLGLVKGGKGLRHHECLLRIPRLFSILVPMVWPQRRRFAEAALPAEEGSPAYARGASTNP